MKFIYGSDWHLRFSAPVCRTDNYAETIIRKGKWLEKLSKEHNAPIISGGDLTDKSLYKSPQDIVLTLNLLKDWPNMAGIVGNHDLLHRNPEYLDKSIISVGINFNKMTYIKDTIDFDNVRFHGFDYGSGGLQHPENLMEGYNIAILHEYVSKEKNDLFGKYVAKDLLKEFPEFDFILTGDNHKTFTEEHQGRILINPGSFLRMDADQIDHKPCVWLLDTDVKSYYPIYVPIEKGVISTDHIKIEKDRNERMEKFVIAMDQEYEVVDIFEENINQYIAKNRKDKDDNVLINSNVENFINISLEGNLGG